MALSRTWLEPSSRWLSSAGRTSARTHPHRRFDPYRDMRRSRLDELEHELVLRLRRVRRILVSGIVRVAQEIAFVLQLESRRLDFLPKKCFFDAMQGTGFGDAGSR